MLKHVSYRSSTNFSKKSEFDSYRRSSLIVSEYGDSYASNRELVFDGSSSYKVSSRGLKCPDTISLRHFANNDDSISINSSFSYGSFAQDNFASRCSSSLSLCDPYAVPVKVYLRRLRPDMEYKTLPMSTATTCREMVLSLLAKFRLRHRDPNLFYVTMEVSVRSADSAPLKRVLVLDDNSRPAELQQCRPKGEARFSIGLRRGGLIRVHDSILMPGSQYKSLLVAHHTTAKEVIQLLLSCYSKTESTKLYTIHEVCQNPFKDRPLQENDCPLELQTRWPRFSRSNRCFILRRNSTYSFRFSSKITWRRSLDHGSTDTESEPDEHNTTRASIISSSSTSSGISSISIDSSSSGVSSGDDSCISTSSSPLKLSTRLLKSITASSAYLFTGHGRQLPKTSTPMSSPQKPRIIPGLDISKVSIISDPSPTRAMPDLSTMQKTVPVIDHSATTPPPIPARSKPTDAKRTPPLLPPKEATGGIITPDKPRPVAAKVTGSSHSDPHPKSSPMKLSVMPTTFCSDVRYSRLNGQKTRKLPPTPSTSPDKTPPKPVPRTLFPPIRSRSLSRDACLVEKKVEDSGCECPDHDGRGRVAHTNSSKSSVSFAVLSHSSPKKAKIRSLSKSFCNLSMTPLKSDTIPLCGTSCKKKLIEKDSSTFGAKAVERRDLKISRSLTISLHNLTDDSQCERNCENCFYI